MSYNPNILGDILHARALTLAELAQRLQTSQQHLERDLARRPEPRQALLKDIAKELALPPFVFFMAKTPPLHDVIPDFRSATPAPSPKSAATIGSIQLASGIQRTAADLGAAGAAALPTLKLTPSGPVDNLALTIRSFFGITLDDQTGAKDAKSFYLICRKKIEDKGIFIIHDSFPDADGSGFCLAHATHPIIVVNTKKQNRARRLFTLIHELAHVLIRQTGISDPFVRLNAIEKFCNKFAGNFLVPDAYVNNLLGGITPARDPSTADVAWAARRLKISQQATVLRLEELGLYSAGAHGKWLRAIHNFGNPDYTDRGGGGAEPPPQEKVKLAKYGFHFATVFDQLLDDSRISEIGLYRISGLKPKYLRSYFNYANSLKTGDLQSLELADD